jgi:hypothetical protein
MVVRALREYKEIIQINFISFSYLIAIQLTNYANEGKKKVS